MADLILGPQSPVTTNFADFSPGVVNDAFLVAVRGSSNTTILHAVQVDDQGVATLVDSSGDLGSAFRDGHVAWVGGNDFILSAPHPFRPRSGEPAHWDVIGGTFDGTTLALGQNKELPLIHGGAYVDSEESYIASVSAEDGSCVLVQTVFGGTNYDTLFTRVTYDSAMMMLDGDTIAVTHEYVASTRTTLTRPRDGYPSIDLDGPNISMICKDSSGGFSPYHVQVDYATLTPVSETAVDLPSLSNVQMARLYQGAFTYADATFGNGEGGAEDFVHVLDVASGVRSTYSKPDAPLSNYGGMGALQLNGQLLVLYTDYGDGNEVETGVLFYEDDQWTKHVIDYFDNGNDYPEWVLGSPGTPPIALGSTQLIAQQHALPDYSDTYYRIVGVDGGEPATLVSALQRTGFRFQS